MGIKLIRISVCYFVVGVCLGMFMSMTGQYDFTPVQVHINLLGWTAMTLAALISLSFPTAA